jgi:hypothetical protein
MPLLIDPVEQTISTGSFWLCHAVQMAPIFVGFGLPTVRALDIRPHHNPRNLSASVTWPEVSHAWHIFYTTYSIIFLPFSA